MESISIISARSTCGLDPQSLPAPPEARLQSGRQKRNGAAAQFFGAAGYSAATAFLHPVGVADEGVIPPQPSEPYQSDTGELTYDPQRRLFLVRAPAAAAVIGFAGRETVAAGPLEVELAGGGSGFVTLLATALDGNPIPESSRLLLSLPGAALRTQPGSDPVRPQPLVRYPGSSTLWTLERDPRAAAPSGRWSATPGVPTSRSATSTAVRVRCGWSGSSAR